MAERLQIIINAKDKFSPAFGRLKRTLPSLKTAFLSVAAASTGVAVAFANIVKVGAAFEQKIKTVGGVMRATQKEFNALAKVARKMGETTEFTATEAAGALQFLGMAGFQASEAIKALPGVLDLSTAANVDLGRSADIASNALTAMRLPIDELSRVNDVFINTMTSSNVNMEQLAESFKYSAPLAQAFGYDIETLSALIGALGNAGIQGSLAGTQLAQSFVKLNKVWEELGIDGTGKGLIDALKAINDAGWDAQKIMSVFDQRAGRAIITLRSMVPQVEELAQANRESSGSAKRLADIMRDTVIGRFKELKSVIESVKIDIFTSQQSQLKAEIQLLTKAIQDNKDVIIEAANAAIKWLHLVAKELFAVGSALKWVDDNITDKIFEFFYGPTKDPSKLELLQQQVKKAQENIHDYYLAMADGEPVDENFLRLQRDKIALLNFEIAALKGRNQAIAESAASPEAPKTPAPPKLEPLQFSFQPIEPLSRLELAEQDISSLKSLWGQYYQSEAERNQAWYSEQQDQYKGNVEALALIDSIYFAKKDELRTAEIDAEQAKIAAVQELYNEQFSTDLEKLQEWYALQIELYAGHQEQLAQLKEVYEARKTEIEIAEAQKRKAAQQKILNDLSTITSAFGKKGFKLAQGLAIVQATMSAYQAFNNALASVPYPYNLVAAAITLAAGLAQVAIIAAQKPPAAHGGLDFVPKEQTFLLDRGERVISPRQNQDLTNFLESGGGAGGFTVAGDLILKIKAPSPIEDMGKDEWRDAAEDAIIPALRELKLSGIKV